MRRKEWIGITLLACGLCAALICVGRGTTEKVKETSDKILAIVSDPALKDPAQATQRREQIRKR